MGGVSSGGALASNNNLFSRDSITSASLLLEEGCDPECVSFCSATPTGCRVTLKDTGINLTIPEGALCKTEEVFCAILTEEKDRPLLNGELSFLSQFASFYLSHFLNFSLILLFTESQSLLSPVISCGPRTLVLQKPSIISFQHCAALKYGSWSISLYHYEHSSLTSSSNSSSSSSSNNPHLNPGSWKKLATMGEETMETPVFMQMDSNQVFLVTDKLEKFCLIGESILGKKAVKTLRLVAYAQAPSSTNEYTIRVYVLDDNMASLEVRERK
jgi:netrin receptor unc-5